MNSDKDKRFIPYDLLRIVSAIGVIFIHASAISWYSLPIDSTDWFIANCYDVLSRFSVVIFFMISGALFLSDQEEDTDIRRLFTHNIARLLIIYIVWSVFYGLLSCYQTGFASLTRNDIIRTCIKSKYHLWFLPALIGFYCLVPILNSWLAHSSKKIADYFVLLFFFLQILPTTAVAFTKVPELISFYNTFRIQLISSNAGYFFLGWYLTKYEFPKKYRKYLYLSVPICLIANSCISTYLSRKSNTPQADIYDSYGIFTFIIIVAVFVFFTSTLKEIQLSPIARNIVIELSNCTLGIYVLHLAVLDSSLPIITALRSLPVIIQIPAEVLVTFVICLIPSILLRRIPVIGKYIC